MTGNHWISVPCIHPADGSVHAIGVVQRRVRGAVEMAGGPNFVDGEAPPLLKLGITVDGAPGDLSTLPVAWQRIGEWLPTFNAQVGNDVTVRGTVFAPIQKNALGMPGIVYAVSFENRATHPVEITFAPGGTLGWRQVRVQTAVPCDDTHVGLTLGKGDAHAGTRAVLTGSAPGSVALAIGVDGRIPVSVRTLPDGRIEWSAEQRITLAPGARVETALYLAVGPEADGAVAMVDALERRGWRALAETTRTTLASLSQSTGVPAADRLVNRHLVFAYFFGVARALDDAQLYLVRTRAPWNTHGLTVREWDALMWTIPAIQLADGGLARELIVRMCEIHGYAPGASVNYLDGMPFCSEFSLEGAAAYALAIDRYIAQTGDDRIVEEPAIADTLYASHEDIAARRHGSTPLYSTEVTPSGAMTLPYTLHGNAVIAFALDIFRQTLDEKTAEKVEGGDLVRAALARNFGLSDDDGSRGTWAAAIDLNGMHSVSDDPSGSAYWLPLYDTLPRTDSTYRRTVKRLTADPSALSAWCAALIGPDAAQVLDRVRRASMDNGMAAERVDESGTATGNGGDAALSGLVAYAAWYAANALGVRI